MSSVHEEVAALDASALTPIVRQALNAPTAKLLDWQVQPITKGSAISHVFRIRGMAQVETQPLPWSTILKIVSAPSSASVRTPFASDKPGHFGYWKREFEIFRSSLLEELPQGLVAPQLYQAHEQADGCWLWLEEIVDMWGEAGWPLEHFASTARRFGQWNVLYVTERPVPSEAWLARDEGLARWLSDQIQSGIWPQLAAIWEREPLMRRLWPDQTLPEFERLWAERERFFGAVARLPQTLIHGDAARKNLMARQRPDGGDETVLLDWGIVGLGPLGQELATLVAATVHWLDLPGQQLAKLDESVFAAYLDGLHDVGWTGNAALVRLGYVADVALRFGFLLTPPHPQNLRFDEESIAQIEREMGCTLEQLLEARATLRHFVVACADEARRLMKVVPS